MINTHVPPVWYVHSTIAYGNALGPLKYTVVKCVQRHL